MEIKPNTSLEIARPKKALEVMASKCNVDPAKLLGTLKATVFKGASDDELLALVVVANQYNLDPLLKQIYAFPAKGGGIVPVVSIDGWISVMNRQPDFDGIEFELADDETGNPHSCTATITLKGKSKPVRITEYFAECARNTEPWKQSPRRMLRHRALIQCARIAFGMAGIYDEDEASYVSAEATIKTAKVVPPHQITMTASADDPLDNATETSAADMARKLGGGK